MGKAFSDGFPFRPDRGQCWGLGPGGGRGQVERLGGQAPQLGRTEPAPEGQAVEGGAVGAGLLAHHGAAFGGLDEPGGLVRSQGASFVAAIGVGVRRGQVSQGVFPGATVTPEPSGLNPFTQRTW